MANGWLFSSWRSPANGEPAAPSKARFLVHGDLEILASLCLDAAATDARKRPEFAGQPHERVARAANPRSRTQNAPTQKAYTQALTRHRLRPASICAGHIRSVRIQFNVM